MEMLQAGSFTELDEAISEISERPFAVEATDQLEGVWRAHHGAIQRLLRCRLDNEDDVAELSQEAFLRLLRYRHCGAAALTRLLYRVAANLAVSHRRQARHRHEMNWDGDLEQVSDARSIESQVEEAERLAGAMRIVARLPPRCRHVFALSRIHGMRHREVASACAISVGMVEKHLSRAQAALCAVAPLDEGR